MLMLAEETEEVRGFVLENGEKLHKAGHSAIDMQALAKKPEEERQAVIEDLKTKG
ncbi:hypothetical protein ACFQDN_12995 [Pseudomonas asuensis]|uniref:Uncharacterized protein n=1 Tax=Pseudomonas asuensis TaxID=1825787 RepID=A0ABQ2GRD5_9PSED|nr:hypothetical protein [Pseudomonas asuensis]GGM07832.1 hypothetical protein GCM10009425_18870 [Pseudomonas asuensis]